ncbi:MAG: quinoprotein relay system zinc metallohydrolase 1 [Gammaproteobacteria bacterium]|nr:quinoprotein relay system zinc metallohydrolase 1 [Gammaproteobacteria bacterium]
MRWILLLLSLAFGSAQAELSYALQPKQIADDVWLLEGSTDNFSPANGGNIVNTAFIVTADGVLVIDSGPSRAYGEAQRAAIATVTDKPVIALWLTHHHPDHVLGNQAYKDVPIAALAGTRQLLAEQGEAMAENMYRLVGDWMRGTEVVLPTATLEAGEVRVGDRVLSLLALSGHTGADLAIFDTRSGVLLAGDLLFYQRALTTPGTPSLDTWLADLDQLQALPWTLLVPGHGPVANNAAPFEQMRDYLGWLDGVLREGAAQGAEMNELIRAHIPERFAAISLSRYELIRSVSHLYPCYERGVMTRVDQERVAATLSRRSAAPARSFWVCLHQRWLAAIRRGARLLHNRAETIIASMVPTLCVGTPFGTLCVRCGETRSVSGCIPTRTVRRLDVGTINRG